MKDRRAATAPPARATVPRHAALAAALIALFTLATPAAAQETAAVPTSDLRPPTVALVLSGGSAKAFAHIGVLKVLEEVGLPVDVVTGTSMGAIVGGLYAIGYTPAQLERVALTTDWDGVFQGGARRDQLRPAQKLGDARYVATFPIRGGRVRLPQGLVSRQRVGDLLGRLTWSVSDARDFRQFPIPFAAVATDLETGESVRLDHGVLADALQASMALPGVFAPMKLDGRSYVDGGVARNLPAADARDMGATVVVCVDVSDPLSPADSLKTAADVLLQTISFQMQRSTDAQRKLCDVLITPDITGLPATSFNKGPVWIARGVAAANAVRPRLREIADSVRALRAESGSRVAGRGAGPDSLQPRPPTPDPHRPPAYAAATPSGFPAPRAAPWDSVYVRQVRVRGHGDAKHRLADRLAGATLSVRTPGWVTPAKLEDALARLYGSGHFERVTYAIVPNAGGASSDIVVDVTPRNEDAFGVGLRYDSERQAALLFSAALHDRLHYGSTAQLDVRLGEQLQFDGQYVFDETPTLHAERRFRVTYLRTPLRLYDGGRSIAEERLHISSVSATVGHTLSTNAAVALEAKGEYAYNSIVTAPVGLVAERAETYYTLGAQLWLDSFDRTVFPTRGGSLIAQSEVADRRIGSGATFSRHVVDGERYLPLGSRTSLTGRLALGWTTGADDLPEHDRFYLGGSIPSALLATQFLPFYGLKAQELSGRGVRLASLGAQRELQRNVFLLARWDVGTTFDTWPSLRDQLHERLRYASGAGLALGAVTPAGPVTFTLASRTREWDPVVDLEFGFRF